MPSSIASFARYGGASATSVYASSVTSARVVRPLYGSVSRARTPMRRRVRRHDQSRTSPPRSSDEMAAGLPDLHALSFSRPWSSPCSWISWYTRVRREQLGLRSVRDDAAVVEDDDLVGERDRREPVRDDDRRPAAHRLGEAGPDLGLGRRVDRGGRVVEDQDAGVDDERPCDREPLSLTARERDAALADHRVVALRQLLDELVRLRSRAARRTCSSVASRTPNAMFSRTVAEKRKGSCEMTPISRRSERRVTSRTSTPSTSTRPSVAS